MDLDFHRGVSPYGDTPPQLSMAESLVVVDTLVGLIGGGGGGGGGRRSAGRSAGSPVTRPLVESDLEALAGDVIHSTKKAGQTLHIPLDTLYNNPYLRYITGPAGERNGNHLLRDPQDCRDARQPRCVMTSPAKPFAWMVPLSHSTAPQGSTPDATCRISLTPLSIGCRSRNGTNGKEQRRAPGSMAGQAKGPGAGAGQGDRQAEEGGRGTQAPDSRARG